MAEEEKKEATCGNIFMSIQPDWQQSFESKESEFWVSTKIETKKETFSSKTTFVTLVEGDETKIQKKENSFLDKNEIPIHLINKDLKNKWICFESENNKREEREEKRERERYKRRFMFPSSSFLSPDSSPVNSLSFSPQETFAISGNRNGQLKVFKFGSGEIHRTIEGHHGEVFSCQFFPSGQVLLSGGGDMQIKIWSLATAKCAATLSGHAGGVLDLSIVDKGKNIISVSRDGRALLWDVSTQKIIKVLEKGSSPIQCCLLLESALSSAPSDLREVQTTGKILVTCSEKESVNLYDVAAGTKITSLDVKSPSSCSSSNSHILWIGTEKGETLAFDTRFPKDSSGTDCPLIWSKEKDYSAVTALTCQGQTAWVGHADGTTECWVSDQPNDHPLLQLTGPLYDPVLDIAVTKGGDVVTASRDSVIRTYRSSTAVAKMDCL